MRERGNGGEGRGEGCPAIVKHPIHGKRDTLEPKGLLGLKDLEYASSPHTSHCTERLLWLVIISFIHSNDQMIYSGVIL